MRNLRRFFSGRLFSLALIALPVLAAGVFLALWLPRALAPIAAAERLFSFAAALACSASKEPEENRRSKIVLIVLLPWVGAIFCLLTLPRGEWDERVRRECTASSAEYFPTGEDMRRRLLSDLAAAKRQIWLQYYIIAEGTFWDEISAVLEERAKDGVDVRLLYDDFGCSFTLPKDFPARAAARGIKAKPLRPVRFRLGSARREHRKIAVIDGVAYTGGINLADEYVGEKIRFGHWKDTALRVTGNAAAVFASLFSERWGGNADMVPPNGSDEGGMSCTVYADGARFSSFREGRGELLRFIAGAKFSLYLNTPYLLPDGALLGALGAAARAGVDVRLMIPHLPDKKFPFFLTRSYARELEEAGVRVREYTAGFLHAKSAVADGALCTVSSYNLDFRSLYLQSECGITLRCEGTAKALERDFLSCWEQGTPVPPAKLPARMLARALRLFAPLI